MIDKCIEQSEFDALRVELLNAIELLPDIAHVGLVTFDKNVFIHDIFTDNFLTEKALNGEKNYTDVKIAELLGFKLMDKNTGIGKGQQPSTSL